MRLCQYSFLFLVFLLTACVDEINFDIERGANEQLVIDGRIIELLDQPHNIVEINVQRVFNFESSSRSTISVESVSISNGLQTIDLPQTGLGQYGLNLSYDDYELNSDLGHTLQVRDLNGRTYQSNVVFKHSVPIPQSLEVNIVSTNQVDSIGQVSSSDYAEVSISTPILDQFNNALLWEATQTFQVSTTQPRKCYVTENPIPDKVLFIDTRTLNLNQIVEYQLFDVPVSKSFREGIYFNIRQYSIDEATLIHYKNIHSLITQTKTIFNNPLNKLSSNIKNIEDPNDQVYGHFYVAQAVDIRAKVDSIRTYCNRPPPFGTDESGDCVTDGVTGCPAPGTNSDPLCCDCRKVEGSVTIKPDYWQ